MGFSEGDGESDSGKEEEIILVQVWVSVEVKGLDSELMWEYLEAFCAFQSISAHVIFLC